MDERCKMDINSKVHFACSEEGEAQRPRWRLSKSAWTDDNVNEPRKRVGPEVHREYVSTEKSAKRHPFRCFSWSYESWSLQPRVWELPPAWSTVGKRSRKPDDGVTSTRC